MPVKEGVLLLNLGTPDDVSVRSVRRYLRQFLSDERVLDMPAPIRWMLLNLIILPRRPKVSAEAYETIWREDGSPLKIFTEQLTEAVAEHMGESVPVRYAMRYQNPSIESALEAFRDEAVERLYVAPLYPQYASSSTGSCLEELYAQAGKDWNAPSLSVVPPFYDHPAFIEAAAAVARETLGDLTRFDRILMSFHGLPERHVIKCDLSAEGAAHCLERENCCDAIIDVNRYCYRAQSYATARSLAAALGLAPERYEVAFQSRLGRTPWIKPYTDERLTQLARDGVERIAVITPSFTADCLETLEEIAIRGREDFIAAGGKELVAVPCVNAHPTWVRGLISLLAEQGMERARQAVSEPAKA
jgi:ferrochelatase